MVDWTASMQQTFEYYLVDPHTWTDKQLITKFILLYIIYFNK